MPSQLDLTLGAVEIGALISTLLYGAVTVQLYTYSGRCKDDPLWLVVVVVGVWILETLYTVLSIIYIYDQTITNFGNPAHIMVAAWPLDVSITVQGTVGTIVQSFFAYRVWKISGTLFWPTLAWLGSAARLALAIAITVFNLKVKNIVVFSGTYNWLIVSSLVVSSAVDILNSGSLTWYLSEKRSGFRSTARVVDKVIIYSIETGLITSITAICMLTTRLTMRDNYVWLAFLQVYAKLYSNSLMVSLNARAGFREQLLDGPGIRSSALNHTTDTQYGGRGGISIQMVSFAESSDQFQKEECEGDISDRVVSSISPQDSSFASSTTGPTVWR